MSSGPRINDAAGTFFESSHSGTCCVERFCPEPVTTRRMQASLRSTPWAGIGIELNVNRAGQAASGRKRQRGHLEIRFAKTLEADGCANRAKEHDQPDEFEGGRER